MKYAILIMPFVAAFIPTLFIRFQVWLWGVNVVDPFDVIFPSTFLGAGFFLASIILAAAWLKEL